MKTIDSEYTTELHAAAIGLGRRGQIAGERGLFAAADQFEALATTTLAIERVSRRVDGEEARRVRLAHGFVSLVEYLRKSLPIPEGDGDYYQHLIDAVHDLTT